MRVKTILSVLGLAAALFSAGTALATPVPLTQVGSVACPNYAQCGVQNAVVGSYEYSVGSALYVYGLQVPTSPVLAATISGIYGQSGLTAADHYLYVTLGNVEVVDLKNPVAPVLVGQMSFPQGGWTRSAISGNYLYVALSAGTSSGLQVVDVSDPTAPNTVASLPIGAAAVAVSGTFAYLVDGASAVHVIDVSQPTAPSEIAHVDLGETPYDIAISGTYAYVVTHSVYCDSDNVCTFTNGHLTVIDISNPSCPKVVSSILRPKAPERVLISGRYAYLTERSTDYNNNHGELTVVDVGNPSAPVDVAYALNNYYVDGLTIAGSYLYVNTDWWQFVFQAFAPSAGQCN